MSWRISYVGPRASAADSLRSQGAVALRQGYATQAQIDAVLAALDALPSGASVSVEGGGHNSEFSNIDIRATAGP